MIYSIMTKPKAIKDVVDTVYPVLQISKKNLKEIATELVDEMFGSKETLNHNEYIEAKIKLAKELEKKQNSNDVKDIVTMLFSMCMLELDSSCAIDDGIFNLDFDS